MSRFQVAERRRKLGIGLVQPLIGKFLLGDVAPDADQAVDRAGGVAQRDFGRQQPLASALGVSHHFLVIEQRFARLHDRGVGDVEFLRNLARKEIEHAFANDFVRALDTEELHVRDVIEEIMPGFVLDVDRVRQVVDHAAEPVALGRELLLHLLEIGDVARKPGRADDAAFVVAQRQLGGERPHDAAIGQRFFFQTADKWLTGLEHALLIIEGLLCMLGQEKIEVAFSNQLLRPVELEKPRHGRVDADEAALAVFEINAVGDVIEQRLKQVALMGERLIDAAALDGVTHCAVERRAVDGVGFKIILCARVDDLERQFGVLDSAQDDHRQMRRVL